MTDKIVFDLSTPADLFNKIKFERSEVSIKTADLPNQYKVLNLLLTFNHLFEWALFYDGYDKDKKKNIIIQFNPYKEHEGKPRKFNKYYNKLTPFPNVIDGQRLFRELSNNYKHFRVEKVYSDVTPVNTACAGSPTMCAGGPKARAGYYEYGFVVDDMNGNIINLLDLFDEFIFKWESIL